MTYEIRCTLTGDSAEAPTLASALLAARTLVRDAAGAGIQGRSRAARAALLIARDGVYDGPATVAAQEVTA